MLSYKEFCRQLNENLNNSDQILSWMNESSLVNKKCNEAVVEAPQVDVEQPVMFSVYGNVEGPWYFGYRVIDDIENAVVSLREGGLVSYPKLVIPFTEFNPIDLAQNKQEV